MKRVESDRVGNEGFFAFRRSTARHTSDASATPAERSFPKLLAEIDENDRLDRMSALADGFDPDALDELQDSIHTLGQRLLRTQSMGALAEYRHAVQSFLRAVLAGFDVESHTSSHSILNRKRYSIAQVVDAKLERLASGLFQTQQQPLDILATLEEIQGLLVDLRH